MKVNYKCWGGYCKDPKGEVRLYPIDGRTIPLCKDCLNAINEWKERRNLDTPPNKIRFECVSWNDLHALT